MVVVFKFVKTQPTKIKLAHPTCHVHAAQVFLNVSVTTWTRFCVSFNPIIVFGLQRVFLTFFCVFITIPLLDVKCPMSYECNSIVQQVEICDICEKHPEMWEKFERLQVFIIVI